MSDTPSGQDSGHSAHPPVTVQGLSWPDLCPALLLFRALPAALSLTAMTLALVGVLLTPLGWNVAEWIFVSGDMKQADTGLLQSTEMHGSTWQAFFPGKETEPAFSWERLLGIGLVFSTMVDSVSGVFSLESGLSRFLYFLTGSLWTILVWSFFGCAICRAALMRFTRDDPVGLDECSRFAADKFLSCFAGITIPLAAVFGLAIPCAIIGLFLTTNPGAIVGGLLWFLVLLFALVMAVILLGLLFAWPLIVSSISCEGQDSFDGMSRGFAYVFQRPVNYFLYALTAVIFSGICWFVMSLFIQGTIDTAWWASSWGANLVNDRMAELTNAPRAVSAEAHSPDNDQPGPLTGTLVAARWLIGFWNGLAWSLGTAFLYGLFWSLAAAVYLLLRRDLDETELDEIWMVDERRTYELPPLSPGEEDDVPEIEPATSGAGESGAGESGDGESGDGESGPHSQT